MLHNVYVSVYNFVIFH